VRVAKKVSIWLLIRRASDVPPPGGCAGMDAVICCMMAAITGCAIDPTVALGTASAGTG